MIEALKQLLKEIKSIEQENMDNNPWHYSKRSGVLKLIEERLEMALAKEGK